MSSPGKRLPRRNRADEGSQQRDSQTDTDADPESPVSGLRRTPFRLLLADVLHQLMGPARLDCELVSVNFREAGAGLADADGVGNASRGGRGMPRGHVRSVRRREVLQNGEWVKGKSSLGLVGGSRHV